MRFGIAGVIFILIAAASSSELVAQQPAPTAPADTWKNEIVSVLTRQKFYPPEARGTFQAGTVKILFAIDRQGHLVSSSVTESSGLPIFDATALMIVRNVSSFPAPPPEVGDKNPSFIVPIVFREGKTSAPPLSKTEQIDKAIDMLANIKSAVAQNRKEAELETYKAVSVRLFQCSAAYGALATTTPSDAKISESLSSTSSVFNDASAILYPDTAENYKKAILVTKDDEALKQQPEGDKRKRFYFFRSCRDFSDPQTATLVNAIAELMLTP
jgi:TonB family protein